MKIIFITTKSITFNTFLKSQADYFIKKGFELKENQQTLFSTIIILNRFLFWDAEFQQ